MRNSGTTVAALAAALTLSASALYAQDASQAIVDGGIKAAGWMGQVDAGEAEDGLTIEDALLQMDGDAVHIKTGPAGNFWHADHMARGSYTVSATFTEPGYMASSDHAHPYGLFIGGRGLDTDSPNLLYCSAYGYGAFIVRGFGSGGTFALNGRRPEANDAVNKAAGENEPVVQHIAVTVSPEGVSCAINGTTVASYPMSEVVADGRLTTLDGQVGVRYGHNVEARITDLTIEQH